MPFGNVHVLPYVFFRKVLRLDICRRIQNDFKDVNQVLSVVFFSNSAEKVKQFVKNDQTHGIDFWFKCVFQVWQLFDL